MKAKEYNLTTPIKLIVGLGNPGPTYSKNRHNVGAWLVTAIASQFHESLTLNSKLQAQLCKITHHGRSCWLMIPTTYMNESGLPVHLVSQFYKIKPEEILVAHDELDLPCATIRMKVGGGHGGHNGLRDIFRHLGTQQFARIRIGIDHPGKQHNVSNYVLSDPTATETSAILQAINDYLSLFDDVMNGEFERVMHQLHTRS